MAIICQLEFSTRSLILSPPPSAGDAVSVELLAEISLCHHELEAFEDVFEEIGGFGLAMHWIYHRR